MKNLLCVCLILVVGNFSASCAFSANAKEKIMSVSKITGVRFVLIYANELEPTKSFYEKYLGFKQTAEFRPGEIYGKAGAIEMWIGSGYESNKTNEKSVRATVMLGVESVGKLFNALKEDGHEVVQNEPTEMQPGTFWLQFKDPSGNVVEVLGAK